MIELVMVIVILGALAAVALPRFVDLKSDAEKAAIDGTVGALGSARTIFLVKAAICGNAYFYTNVPFAFWVGLEDPSDLRCEGSDTRGHSFDAKQIRSGLMKNPTADLFKDNLDNGNVIEFETKSGRVITITNNPATGTLTYAAAPPF